LEIALISGVQIHFGIQLKLGQRMLQTCRCSADPSDLIFGSATLVL
jgi:hypothetical protein